MSSGEDDSITVTLVSAMTGTSESIPVSAGSTTLEQVLEYAVALLGLEDEAASLAIYKDGKRILSQSSYKQTLKQAGIRHGDVLAIQPASSKPNNAAAAAAAAGASSNRSSRPASGGGGGGGGLDFSNLLAGAEAPSSSSAILPGLAQPQTAPVYWEGMDFQDAVSYNPHPAHMVTLLKEKQHLMKELNYHNPTLALKLQTALPESYDKAVQIWREETVKGVIASAVRQTKHYHTEKDMTTRLQRNPDDETALAYFRKKENQQRVEEQYRQMMEEYPESLGRVIMLYIDAKINGHAIQPFCDSGAQVTLMSKKVCKECGLFDWIDERFAGMATGVGTGKILGRIHVVQLQIGPYYFPCTVQVMDDPKEGATEMPFLLGLDMMKRHLCQIDLEKGVLRFSIGGGVGGGAVAARSSSSSSYETPFLHEKDLSVKQGGTKDFDADQSNREFMERLRRRQERGGDDEEDDDDDDDVKMEQSK